MASSHIGGERESLLHEHRHGEGEERPRHATSHRIDKNTFHPRYFSQYFTKHLARACGLVAISTFNYAFDQQGFNSTQAMDAFNKTFGHYDATKGRYVLPAYYLSLLNSLVYVGFAFGRPIICEAAFLPADEIERRIYWQRHQCALRQANDHLHHVSVGHRHGYHPRYVRH